MKTDEPNLDAIHPGEQRGIQWTRVITSPLFAWALLAIVLVWELAVLSLSAGRRLLGYDELVTFHVSKFKFPMLLRALWAGVDTMPPGYHAIVKLTSIISDNPLVALRLPSIVGYFVCTLSVYLFVRKRLTTFAGLVAVLLITLSPFREYALEARSYSLLVGFLAISAVVWQRIDEKPFMVPLLAVTFFLAISCHYLAVVTILCFGTAELAWTTLSRRIRWGVWAAYLLATCPFFLTLPLLLHYRDVFGEHFWAKPSWETIYSTYQGYLGIEYQIMVTFVTLFILMLGRSLLKIKRCSGKPISDHGFSIPEMILIGGFLLYPALLVVLTKVFGSGYTARYGWPGILGLVFGTVYLVKAIWFKSSSVYLLTAFLIAFIVQGINDLQILYRTGSNIVDDRWTKLTELSRAHPDIPVVIGSPHAFLEATEYAPIEVRKRLVEVVDPDMATRFIGTDSIDKANRLLAQFIPLGVKDLAVFQAADNKKFILLSSSGGYDWFTQYLLDNGYHLRLLSRDTDNLLYIAIEREGDVWDEQLEDSVSRVLCDASGCARDLRGTR